MKMKKLYLGLFLFLIFCLSIGCSKHLDETINSTPSSTTIFTAESSTNFQFPKWEDPEEPWNFSPACGHDDCYNLDIEFVLEQTVFTEIPKSITYTRENKTPGKEGKDFCFMATALEKKHYYVYSFVDLPFPPAWIREPFYGGAPILGVVDGKKTEITIVFDRFMQNGAELTPGEYRLVFFVGNEPQYVYFEIKA